MQKKSDSNSADDNELFDKEFEEADFGQLDTLPNPVLIKASERRGRPKLGRKFNVVMSDELIIKLQEAGNKRGVGYQTMVRLICSEHIAKYLEKTAGDQE